MAGPHDIRVLADDLTGALDSAVAFAGAGAGVRVAWRPDTKPCAGMAIDAATREGTEADAVARHAALASWLAEGSLRTDFDPGLAERFTFGLINSLVEWYRPGGRFTPDEIADAVLRFMRGGLTSA